MLPTCLVNHNIGDENGSSLSEHYDDSDDIKDYFEQLQLFFTVNGVASMWSTY